MNIFKAIICHDYSVLRTQRQSIQVKTNGIHMIGLTLIANLLTIASIVLIYFLVNEGRENIYFVLNELHYWEIAGRVGIIDTGLRTAQSGYIQRKLVKKMENYKVSYSGLITDSNENVLQFNYEDNIDPARKVWANGKKTFVNATSLIDQLNHEVELREYKK